MRFCACISPSLVCGLRYISLWRGLPRRRSRARRRVDGRVASRRRCIYSIAHVTGGCLAWSGKHPHCRIALSGVVRAEAVAVSKRLAFFTLQAHGAGTTFDQECLVKFRDGCLTEDEIAMLVAALSASDASGHHTHVQVKLLGFPELADDCLSHSVHVIQATVSSDADDETSARTFPEGDIREPLSEEKAPAVRRKQSGNHARQRTLIGIHNSSRG